MLRLITPKSRIAPILKAIFILSFFIVNTPTATGGFFTFLKNISDYNSNFEVNKISVDELIFTDYEIDDVKDSTITICSGNFYDAGGAGGDYGFFDNFSTTFCADNGGTIEFDFTTWGTDGSDNLSIFDGANNSAILIGNYSGTSPGVVTSTGSCLHFHFTSSFPGNGIGWEATISCNDPIGIGYPMCSNSDEVGGVIFQDANLDGVRTIDEPFYEGMTVNLFDDNALVNSTTTNASGEFLFTGLTSDQDFRIEYTLPSGYQEGPMGAFSKSSVQFVTTGTCDASLGIILPEFYCHDTPDFATTCFVDGDPLGGGNSGNLDVLVSTCLLYTSPSPRDATLSRMPSSA